MSMVRNPSVRGQVAQWKGPHGVWEGGLAVTFLIRYHFTN